MSTTEVKKDAGCGYCMRGELLDKFGIFICDLSVSSLILFKEQSKPGRCIVAYKDHVSEIVDISDEERNAFMADVNRAAKAIHAAFHPDKLNYGAYAIPAAICICTFARNMKAGMSGEEPSR